MQRPCLCEFCLIAVLLEVKSPVFSQRTYRRLTWLMSLLRNLPKHTMAITLVDPFASCAKPRHQGPLARANKGEQEQFQRCFPTAGNMFHPA
ncbi:hypothetical protein J3F84DRAFT_379278 [Trichoderma pleuroticola]